MKGKIKNIVHCLLGMFFLSVFFSCQKSNERACFKSNGEIDSLVIPLDSVNEFKLYKSLRYTIVQDDKKEIRVKGGKNLIQFISAENNNGICSIENKNKCNFFRSNELVEVEIHYPFLKRFYIEATDSVVFKNQIVSDSLFVEFRNGGGSGRLNVDVNFLMINVSHGTADYHLSGTANNAEVKIQNNGFADASAFNASTIFVYNNSTGDLRINLNNSVALIGLEGTGDVIYSGQPADTIINRPGSGMLIKM